jgi:hypothetical protein
VTGNSVEGEHRLSLATPVQDRESNLISQDLMPHQHMLADRWSEAVNRGPSFDLVPALAAVAIFVLPSAAYPDVWLSADCALVAVRHSAAPRRASGVAPHAR